MTAVIRTPRQHLADQYAREGRHSTARKILAGQLPSETVLRSLRAIQTAQIEALAARKSAGLRKKMLG
jgi:hypothetical protein